MKSIKTFIKIAITNTDIFLKLLIPSRLGIGIPLRRAARADVGAHSSAVKPAMNLVKETDNPKLKKATIIDIVI
jgi:hypothetical protein